MFSRAALAARGIGRTGARLPLATRPLVRSATAAAAVAASRAAWAAPARPASPLGSYYSQRRAYHCTRPVFGNDDAVVGASLIPIVNKLQEVFAVAGTDLDLPQIVVIGGQSSGKSSVLENLVGRDFLPRGTGIVTRRPLILQLNKLESGVREYGEFAHLPDKKFYDFSKIRDEIAAETDRLTGSNKGVSPEPIILRVYSSSVLPLTLVDTPGIARVPVGDQPKNIESLIRDMVTDYIAPKNAIILAVQPANQDIATSDALQLARTMDPVGARTIGVLTKLDLMDGGTNALDVLNGKVIPLNLGFVGVVNRGQSDILKNKSIARSLRDERKFFDSHPAYSAIADKSGTEYLAQTCNKLLNKHIREELPRIKADVHTKLQAAQRELMDLGEAPGGTVADKKWLLLQVLNKFCLDFKDIVQGNRTTVASSGLHGGARIRYIFDEVFRKKLAAISPTAGISIDEYRTTIRNAAGPRPALFVPEGAFEMLVRRQIMLLREPALQCAELVQVELQRIAAQLDHKELGRFVLLKDKVNMVSAKVLQECLAPAKDMINKLLECELAYINTNHPDFIGGAHGSLLRDGLAKHKDEAPDYRREEKKAAEAQSSLFGMFFGSKKAKPPPKSSSAHSSVIDAFTVEQIPNELRINSDLTDREKIQIGLIKKLLESYFDIARKNVQDSVTKAIWHFLVNQTEDKLHKALITELYQDGKLEDLLSEAKQVEERRKELQKEVAALAKAKQILQVSELPPAV